MEPTLIVGALGFAIFVLRWCAARALISQEPTSSAWPALNSYPYGPSPTR